MIIVWVSRGSLVRGETPQQGAILGLRSVPKRVGIGPSVCRAATAGLSVTFRGRAATAGGAAANERRRRSGRVGREGRRERRRFPHHQWLNRNSRLLSSAQKTSSRLLLRSLPSANIGSRASISFWVGLRLRVWIYICSIAAAGSIPAS